MVVGFIEAWLYHNGCKIKEAPFEWPFNKIAKKYGLGPRGNRCWSWWVQVGRQGLGCTRHTRRQAKYAGTSLSNHYSDATWLPWRLKSTANRLFVQKFVWTKQQWNSKLHITGPLWGNPSVTGGFPSQKDQQWMQKVSASKLWRHHGTTSISLNVWWCWVGTGSFNYGSHVPYCTLPLQHNEMDFSLCH